MASRRPVALERHGVVKVGLGACQDAKTVERTVNQVLEATGEKRLALLATLAACGGETVKARNMDVWRPLMQAAISLARVRPPAYVFTQRQMDELLVALQKQPVADTMSTQNNNAMQKALVIARQLIYPGAPPGAAVPPGGVGTPNYAAVPNTPFNARPPGIGTYVPNPLDNGPRYGPARPDATPYGGMPNGRPASAYDVVPGENADYGVVPGEEDAYVPIAASKTLIEMARERGDAMRSAVFGISEAPGIIILAIMAERTPPKDYTPVYPAVVATVAPSETAAAVAAVIGDGLKLVLDLDTRREELRATRAFVKDTAFTEFSTLERMDKEKARLHAFAGHTRFIRALGPDVFVHGHMCILSDDANECAKDKVGGGVFANDTVDEFASSVARPRAGGKYRQVVHLLDKDGKALQRNAELRATSEPKIEDRRLVLVALRDIAVGENIYVDYGAEYWNEALRVE